MYKGTKLKITSPSEEIHQTQRLHIHSRQPTIQCTLCERTGMFDDADISILMIRGCRLIVRTIGGNTLGSMVTSSV